MLSKNLNKSLDKVIGKSDSPIVIYSSTWPFFKAFEKSEKFVETLMDTLIRVCGERSVLMPTFTNLRGGYKEGIFNSDNCPSETGVLTEEFRKRPDTERTLSAFFSFSVKGDAQKEVLDLKPKHCYGKGSLYEWMEDSNVTFLMLGTHPSHCSWIHRLEWIERNRIKYRINKRFKGTILRQGVSYQTSETLFVKEFRSNLRQSFHMLLPYLVKLGMKVESIQGISVASIRAKDLRSLSKVFRENPFITIENWKEYY